MDLFRKYRHAVTEICQHYDEPIWWQERLIDHVVHPFHANIHPTYDDAIEVVNEDWDNLIILDACRLDLFEERVDYSNFDTFEPVTSYGSSTPEWTHQNFHGREYGDIVYISSNPWTSRIAGDSFHEVIEVWRDSFDEELGTVPADPVVDAAESAIKEYPNKRIIIHFMQPHVPFVSPEFELSDWSPERIVNEEVVDTKSRQTVWEALRRGEIDYETAWEGYGDNLDYVMERVDDFAPSLPGRTVVSSDHGNMLGERTWPLPIRIFGHPDGVRSPELVEVPWGVYEGDRRTIVDDGVTPVKTGSSEELENRLAALGYR
ncbi:hypothetical protein [Halobacterium sp. KA-6]|uniref:hypothetical protein n=1 Tax=Halobacterium sp. KA-6 TaxID=2896368 RepID=UPI001E4B03FB|nr:hypothetical protein [Halobacterium sp. KA-6]MCD2205024.1 hypothetical protein [Halobacterium sp. KA-6]